MSEPLKIIFMGTPDFACVALEKIHETSTHEVIALYSQPPRPKGRGHKLQPSPTHAYAEAHNIPVFTPKSLKKPAEQEAFSALKADIAIVAAYGLILPKAVLDAPQYGCLNIHASLLPRWRGASPIQRSIWTGDEETGVTIMQMDEGLDTGPMIAKSSISLNEKTTCTSLHDELAMIGGELIIDVLDKIALNGVSDAQIQDNTQSCYAPLLKKEDGRIDWSKSSVEIDRQIRALNPWPGTFSNNFKIKAAELREEKSDKTAGTVLDKSGRIACGDGTVLKLLQIQPAGKKAMDFASALNGAYLEIGQKLQ